MKRSRIVRLLPAVLLAALLAALLQIPVYAEHKDYTPQELLVIIEEVIAWEKEQAGVEAEENLFHERFLQEAGTTTADWVAVGLGRCGSRDDYGAYLAVLADEVSTIYADAGIGLETAVEEAAGEKRSKTAQRQPDKATEWQRWALAVMALGGDPTQFGTDSQGEPIDLIADGSYDWRKIHEGGLGAQGLNGWIYGLIALDGLRIATPEGSADDRSTMIRSILSQQLENGGFALDAVSADSQADVDMTAMAVQALAPYYNSEEVWQPEGFQQEPKTVRQAIDEALLCLASLQNDQGDFSSWGMDNSESCCQVIMALTALGIDPATDTRFIKADNTLLDVLLSYRHEDGGFVHSRERDESNPDADPNCSNAIAGQQAVCALTALCRYYGDMRTLYDFREEMSGEQKAQITAARDAIADLADDADREQLSEAYETYLSVPAAERCYIYQYHRLADLMEANGMAREQEPLSGSTGIQEHGCGAVNSLFGEDMDFSVTARFTEEDAARAKEIPDNGSTEYYVLTVTLLDKLQKAENSGDYEEIERLLQQKRAQIDHTKKEIEAINATVAEKLYPLDRITKEKQQTVKEIKERISALSEYDRAQILRYEDIEQAEVRIKNQTTARTLALIAAAVILVLVTAVAYRVHRRKVEKRRRHTVLDGEDDNDDDDDEDDDE